jgi:hypothetical protein
MKSLFIIIIALFLSITAKSQNTLKDEFGIDIKNTSKFSTFVCATYYISLNVINQSDYFDSQLMKFLGLDENHSDRKKIIGKVLNEYHQFIICGKDNIGNLRDRETLIKRSIGRGEFGLIGQLMIYDEEYGYNLNNYEIVNGEKETILDYIENILNNPSLLKKYREGPLKLLHNDFIEYEAKRGDELN